MASLTALRARTDRLTQPHPENNAPETESVPRICPAGAGDARPAGPASAPSADSDEIATEARIQRIARAVAQGSVEVLGGSRPLQQMAPWLDPLSYERLQLRANLVRSLTRGTIACAGPGSRLHRNVSVRAVRTCRVTAQVYEASVVLVDHHRARAVALRLERRRGNWKVTALEIG